MPFMPKNFVVWFEIPCTDLTASMRFYSKVFDLELKLDETGPNPMVHFPTAGGQGVAGHLYPGKPAPKGSGSTVHLAVPDNLEAAIERVKAAGGEVTSQVITIPAGRFAYCDDPDGNSLGLFQG